MRKWCYSRCQGPASTRALRIIFSKAAFSCFMSFLLFECSYCLTECWPFDQVSWSFCDLTTRTRLFAFIKNPGNIQFKRPQDQLSTSSARSKATVINCFTALRCRKDVFWGTLPTLVSSPIISLNFHSGMRVAQSVTSLLFWPRQDVRQILGSTSQLRTAEKQFSLTVCVVKQKSHIRKFRFSSTLNYMIQSSTSEALLGTSCYHWSKVIKQ